MRRVNLSVVVLCLAIVGCASFQAIDPRKTVNVGDDVTIDPQLAWANAAYPGLSGTIWTIDGFGLNELRFYTGIAKGAPLMRIPGVAVKDLTVYDPTMLPNDVMELVAGTLGKSGSQQLHTDFLRPAKFGSMPGFRFDLDYNTDEGLQMKGVVLFAQRRSKLDLIMFLAPAEYYFERHVAAVEQIFASVKIPDVPVNGGSAD